MEMPVCPVPAGTYPIGDAALPFAAPAHTVTLRAFAIGAHAVTNAQYAAFVAAGGYDDAGLWSEAGWRWWLTREGENHGMLPAFSDDVRFNHPLQPVVGVGWYEADAFARWLARTTGRAWRLPSEVEWEAAARGLAARGVLAEPLPPLRCNTRETGLIQAWHAFGTGGQTWCGAWNLLGNVWEWVSTRWGRAWQTLDYPYPYAPDDGREDASGSHARVMRGGSWYDPAREAVPAARARYLPGSRASNIGFRLVVSG